MYLKKIEIQGFKSFANKTEIKFKDDITAIVGPNGSGKSNISDAIRWVLGEQSIKSLRGSKMEDVIFSGTDKRRALGFAEVSIYFDNEDNTIPIEYSEVVVTRRVFRSGESEYYINKNSCRLKDIRNIFMDTGVGKDGYSIIGQGRIDEILSNRSEDRRNIFEEASEIVKYKSKKQEAEKRLNKTKINLDRIKDLIHEISSQEKSLKREAEKSNEFLNHYGELKDLEIKLHAKEIISLKEKIEKDNNNFLKFEKEIIEIQRENSHLKSEIEKIKKRIALKEESIEILREENIDTIKKLENAKNDIVILKEKDNYSKKNLKRLEDENLSIQEKSSVLNKRTEEIKEKKQSHIDGYKILIKKYDLLKDKSDTLLEEVSKLEENLEKENKQIIEKQNNLYKTETEIENLNSINLNSQDKLVKLNSDLEEIKNNIRKNMYEIDNLNSIKGTLDKKAEEYKLEKKNLSLKIQDLQKEGSKIDENIKNLQIQYESTLSKYNLYKNMEENYEGYYKGVRNLIREVEKSKDLGKGYIGIVAELFRVERQFETAIDISLGGSLQNCVVENEFTAKKMIDFLKTNGLGRVTFLPLDTIKSNRLNNDFRNEQGVLGLGYEVINYERVYANIFESLLGRTIIVDNLDNGIKFANKFNHRYRVVTLDGEILNPGGSLSGGSWKNNNISIVSRKNRIDELEINIKNIEKNITEIKELKNKNLKDIRNLLEDMKTLDLKTEELESEIYSNKDKTQSYKNFLNLENGKLKNAEEEIESLQTSLKDFNKDKNKYLFEKDKLCIDLTLLKEESSKNTKDLKEKKSLMNEVQEEATNLKIETNKMKNNIDNLVEEIKRKSDEYKSFEINYKNIIEEIKTIKTEMINNKEKKIEAEKNIEKLEMQDRNINNKLSEIIETKRKLNEKNKSIDKKIEEYNYELNNLEKKKNIIDLNMEKWEFKIDSHRERLYEDYEFILDDPLELNLEEFQLKESRDRIIKLKSQIKSLGNVNVSSIEEYKEVKGRLDFFKKQHTDLIEGKKDLENIILDMEKKMKLQFMESFKIINKNFAEIFSKLFNGGKASLKLDEDENILEAGIQIEAQPPGKKLQNLNLLSGGEKSLTAVALLFAILKSKPSPFCVLDEIDAALDDTNISRYTEFLKQFNEDTQFILITHRKTTMEIADVLYGVTMEEDGISQLISIKLEDDIDGLAS